MLSKKTKESIQLVIILMTATPIFGAILPTWFAYFGFNTGLLEDSDTRMDEVLLDAFVSIPQYHLNVYINAVIAIAYIVLAYALCMAILCPPLKAYYKLSATKKKKVKEGLKNTAILIIIPAITAFILSILAYMSFCFADICSPQVDKELFNAYVSISNRYLNILTNAYIKISVIFYGLAIAISTMRYLANHITKK